MTTNKNAVKIRGANAKDGSLASQPVMGTAIIEQYSGPIPDAKSLKQYEDILPGAADRILTMAERQSQHRQRIESAAIQSNIKNSQRGQIFAFIISLVVILTGSALILLGKNAIGLFMVVADLVALVAVFSGNRISQSRELSKKNPAKSQESKEEHQQN